MTACQKESAPPVPAPPPPAPPATDVAASVPEATTRSGPEVKSSPPAAAAGWDSRIPYTPFAKVDETDPASLEIPREGAAQPLVVVVEAGDYECEHTRNAEKEIAATVAGHGDSVARFFVHNPLPGHRNGYLLALAAAAAQRQGRFWEFHSLLTEQGPALDEDKLLAIARKVGLDVPLFLKDLKREELKQHLERNRVLVAAMGLTGTPLFIVNGKVVMGWPGPERFADLLEEELEAAGRLKAKSASPAELHETVAAAFDPYRTIVAKGIRWEKQGETLKAGTPWTRHQVSTRTAVATFGPGVAPVTVVEFLDPACPHSAKAWAQAKNLAEEYRGEVRFVIKLNPAGRVPEAELAARAALAAAKAGRAGRFLDEYFANPNVTAAWALACGPAGGEEGIASPCPDPLSIQQQAQADLDSVRVEAQLVSAIGTPILYVNGLRRAGFVEDDQLKPLLAEEIRSAAALIDKGMRPEAVYPFLTARGVVTPLVEDSTHNIPIYDPLRFGPREAPAQVIVYWSYRSPFCRNLWPHIRLVLDRGKENAAVTLRPVADREDPLSYLMSTALICGTLKGKMESTHASLLAMTEASEAKVLDMAVELGLDREEFRLCLGGEEATIYVDNYVREQEQEGLGGTPVVLVNGRRLKPPTGLDAYSILAGIRQVGIDLLSLR